MSRECSSLSTWVAVFPKANSTLMPAEELRRMVRPLMDRSTRKDKSRLANVPNQRLRQDVQVSNVVEVSGTKA